MIEIKNIIPRKDLVIIKLVNIKQSLEGLLIKNHSDETEIAVRYGKVISMGSMVDHLDHCKDLKINDNVIFTEYAGYYIANSDNTEVYKVIRGYEIIGKYMTTEEVYNAELLIPTGNRVLVEIINNVQEENIIYSAKDPKLADLSYGKILKINPNINKLELTEGQIVAFAPYVGTLVRQQESKDESALKIIVEDDILFTA